MNDEAVAMPRVYTLNHPPECGIIPDAAAATPERSCREMRPLGFAIKEWMEVYKKGSVKEATYNRLVVSYRIMLNYGICNIATAAVSTKDVQNYINKLVDAGYARSTIIKQYRLLTAYYAFAIRERMVDFSPVLSVALPKEDAVQKKKRQVEAYTVPQQKALTKVLATHEHPEYAVAEMILETGMRIGEALALSWDDIDWDRQAIRIHKTVIIKPRDGKYKIQDSPKSEASNRIIPMSKRAYALLCELYEAADDDAGQIFVDSRHEILTYESMKRKLAKACKEANVPYRGTHIFRHTFATNCYHRGCDVKLLSKMLGHASAAITYNVYIHLYGDALEDMRSVVG